MIDDEIYNNAKAKMIKAVEYCGQELSQIRTGRASTNILDNIKVDYYGTPTPLKNIAHASTPDPQLILVQPFDPTSLEIIEKAIIASDTGLVPNNDGNVIRINVPVLTEERRKELVKGAYKFGEDGKVSIRNIRRDANEQLKKEKDSGLSEDNFKRALDNIQELTDDYIKKIDDLILHNWPRSEKIAHKDIKMRTFISQEKGRKQLVSHVYDISYGVVEPGESLVVIDDSIVRGTTLRESILKILARTDPKKIVVVSSAPQIRYPDCYGIDMSELGKFIAFQAAIDLLKNSARASLIAKVYDDCREELSKPVEEMRNCVRDIYEPFTAKEISKQIARLVYPQDIKWSGEVEVIYQSIENLRAALGQNCGDWYFTGNYPTPAGTAVVNRAFIQYCDGIEGRPYDLGL